MIRYGWAAALVLMAMSSVALAESASPDYAGGLSPREVTGKRLLDANGTPIGQIEKATMRSAVVRTPNGKHIQVDMAKLTLGDGPHTVIETGDSDADKLNRQAEGDK